MKIAPSREKGDAFERPSSGKSEDADAVKPRLSRFFHDTVNSTPRTLLVLLLLMLWAAATGVAIDSKILPLIIIPGIILLVLGAFFAAVVYSRNDDNHALTIFVTLALLSPAVLSVYFSGIFRFHIQPCRVVALSLVVPFLILCLNQPEKMHIAIATAIVFPSLLASNLAYGLSTGIRYALYLPTAVFWFYKCTAWRLARFGDYNIKWIRISSGVMVTGAALSALAMVLPESAPVRWLPGMSGFLVFIVGFLVFFATLMELRLLQEELNEKADAHRHSTLRVIGSIAMLLLMAANLAGIYVCFARVRPMTPVLIIILLCIFLVLVYLHNPIRDQTPNFAYFFLILVFFGATFYSISLQVPLLEADDPRIFSDAELTANSTASELISNSTSTDISIAPMHTETTPLKETAWFAFMASLLLLFYAMMTGMLKVDKHTKEGAEAARIRREELGPMPNIAPAAGAAYNIAHLFARKYRPTVTPTDPRKWW